MKTIKNICTISAASILLLGLLLFAMPPTNAYAQSPVDEPGITAIDTVPDEPIPPAGQDGKLQQAVLDRLFLRAQKNHENQEKLINQADKLGNRIAELIARAKENGKDTTALEKALTDFNGKIGEARLRYDQNGKLIKQHSGFDDAGKVTDAAAARSTLEEIRNGSKEVRQTLGEALKGLKGAGKAFREANPKSTDSPTTNPA
jgi:hypothetical protein